MPPSSPDPGRSDPFLARKHTVLHEKDDKSSAGAVDLRARPLCAVLNASPCYYTASSCSGRVFLYAGAGDKRSSSGPALPDASAGFRRWRVCHGLLARPARYFDLSTLAADPTGGDGDGGLPPSPRRAPGEPVWMRYEPFILHVACRSLGRARRLVELVRPTFKNVGLTAWSRERGRYTVAIWGEGGVEMPLTDADGRAMWEGREGYLGEIVNALQQKNWERIRKFEADLAAGLAEAQGETDDDDDDNDEDDEEEDGRRRLRFETIGDVAILRAPRDLDRAETDWDALAADARGILRKNRGIKIVALRAASLSGAARAPGDDDLRILAGPDRSPLVTTVSERGVRAVADLRRAFFSPRMADERGRLCRAAGEGERVLVAFAGIGMEGLLLAARTPVGKVVLLEAGKEAARCAELGRRMLERNRTAREGAAGRVEVVHGEVETVVPEMLRKDPELRFDRIVAPRPKEGVEDGDRAGEEGGGVKFLRVLLPALKSQGGKCHWYDFAADHEMPDCQRTRDLVTKVCGEMGLGMRVLHVANAGSVAKRQYRICLDFELTGPITTTTTDDAA